MLSCCLLRNEHTNTRGWIEMWTARWMVWRADTDAWTDSHQRTAQQKKKKKSKPTAFTSRIPGRSAALFIRLINWSYNNFPVDKMAQKHSWFQIRAKSETKSLCCRIRSQKVTLWLCMIDYKQKKKIKICNLFVPMRQSKRPYTWNIFEILEKILQTWVSVFTISVVLFIYCPSTTNSEAHKRKIFQDLFCNLLFCYIKFFNKKKIIVTLKRRPWYMIWRVESAKIK